MFGGIALPQGTAGNAADRALTKIDAPAQAVDWLVVGELNPELSLCTTMWQAGSMPPLDSADALAVIAQLNMGPPPLRSLGLDWLRRSAETDVDR